MEKGVYKDILKSKHLLRLIIALPIGIFLAEVVAMILVLLYRGSYEFTILLDATIATVLVLPLIYLVSYRPLLKHIAERERAESIMQVRLRLMQYAVSHTVDELLQATLDEVEVLTDSTIGFFHFIEADQKTLWLQAWSTNTLQNMCEAEGKGSHYSVDKAGVWADCVGQRKPVIHNNYASLLHRKGTPEGHAPIIREISVPVLRGDLVVAIIGVGNKPQDYVDTDVELVSTLADFVWDIIERRQAEDALRESEDKFRTLVEWTYDWEKWIDPQGNIVYTSPSCERITGYLPEEFISNPHLLVDLVHPDDRESYEAHKQLIHDEKAGINSIEYRIIARDGIEHWIEHICRPLFAKENQYLGRRVSSRDITERKQAEKEIEERNLELQALSISERKQRQEAETLRAATQALTQTLNLDTVLNTLLKHVSALVETEIASIGFIEEEAPMGIRSGQHPDGDFVPLFPVNAKTDPFFKKIAESRKSLLVHDASQDPDWIDFPGIEPVRSWLGVPILVNNKVMGVVLLGKTQPGFFSQDHARSVETLVSQAVVAIQNAWLFGQVRAGRERSQSLSRKLVEIQEAERRYIARELHDQAGQSLTSLILGLGQLEKEAEKPTSIRTNTKELKFLANNILEDLHRLAVDLRPASLEHLGLVPALEQLVTSFIGKSQLKVKFKSMGLSKTDHLPAEVEATLYRIVQEALTNVTRHSDASMVDVILEQRGEAILVIIEDNGVGFDTTLAADNTHLGLIGIRERTEILGGNLTIESIIGSGTTVVVEVPNANTHLTS